MSDTLRNGLIRFSLVAMLACYYVGGLVADAPEAKPHSEFAPLADLVLDLDRRVTLMESASEPSSSDAMQRDSWNDQAQVLAIVASQLPIHDQWEAENLDLPASLSTGKNTPDLSIFTREFPLCYAQLRQGIYSSRFDADHMSLAGRSATMALLAHCCAQEETYCPEQIEQQQWTQVCLALRDSAHEVNLACHANSQTAAVTALQRLEQSCADWQVAASGNE